MTTMRAMQMMKNGGREVMKLNNIPIPSVGPNDILVKNKYAGINFIDVYFRKGVYPTKDFPATLGKEGAGEIVSKGDQVKDFEIGDKVVYSGTNGSYAEYCIVAPNTLAKIPDDIDMEVACASFIQGLTAVTLVEETYKVQKGDYVLVHACSGGMGSWLCQIIPKLGATVIGTASTQAKLDLGKSLGAQHVINYSTDDVVTKVKEIVPEGVHVVYDGVGKDTVDISLNSLRRKGFWASFGNASGTVTDFSIYRLTPKCLKMARPQLFGYLVEKEELDMYTGKLWEFLRQGIKVNIHKTYTLEDAVQAHEDLEGRVTTGKLLLAL